MLTDAEVGEWNTQWRERSHGRPLRNLTPEQWRGIAAMLRREIRNQKRSSRRPTRVESIEFLIAVNFYREDASAPTPKQQARQFAGVVENLRALIERAYIARPDLTDDLACLNEMFERWKWKAEDARYLVADRKPPSEDQVREAEAAAAAMERLFGHGDPSSNTAPARRPAKHRKRPPDGQRSLPPAPSFSGPRSSCGRHAAERRSFHGTRTRGHRPDR